MSFIDPNKSGLEKAAAILGTVFLVSLGLCGLNFVAVTTAGGRMNGGSGQFLFVTAYLELAGMAMGAVGLVIVAIVAIVRGAISNFSSKGSAPVSIIEKDEDK